MSEASAIISGVISLFVSALVTIFTGDRWVERAQRKQKHSQQFVNVINQFFTSFDGVFPVTSIRDNENNCYTKAIVRGLDGVNQGKYLEEHIRTGYPKIAKKLDEYNEEHDEIVSLELNLKNDITNEITSAALKLNIPVNEPRNRDQLVKMYVDHYVIKRSTLLKTRNELVQMLTEVRNEIELANIVNGKCSACPYKAFF